ncbi:MAG: hypothetical protein M2R45_00878 [Verrucomicrobia subdivision 3 bacterium]|nr:hypothetical protein [Limisphaerales bacterium]MCS1414546.1 hypothetical protein [Limisphaerales bacterium]
MIKCLSTYFDIMRRLGQYKPRFFSTFKWFIVIGLTGTAVMKLATAPFDAEFNAPDAALPWFTQKQLLLNAALAELAVAALFLAPQSANSWRYGALFVLSTLFLCYRTALALVGASCSCAGKLSTNPWVAGGLWAFLIVALAGGLIGLFLDEDEEGARPGAAQAS